MAKIDILLTTGESILLIEGWPKVVEGDLNSLDNIKAVEQNIPPNCPAKKEGHVFLRAGRKLTSTIFVKREGVTWFISCFRPNRSWGPCANCPLASPIGGIDPKYATA